MGRSDLRRFCGTGETETHIREFPSLCISAGCRHLRDRDDGGSFPWHGPFPVFPTLCTVHSPSFYQIQHSEAESFPRCQCHLWRVALPDAHGAADLLGDDHPAQVVDPSHDSSCLHIVKPFLLLFFPWQELASDVVFPAGGWLCWKNYGREGGQRPPSLRRDQSALR